MIPDQKKKYENEEIVSLNAEELDADQLDDQELEDVAGGSCGINCGINTSADNP